MKKIFYNFINIIFKEKSRFIVFESNDDFCEGTFEFYKYCKKTIKTKDLVWFIKKTNRIKAKRLGVKKIAFIDSNSIFQRFKKYIYSRQCRWYCYSHRFLMNKNALNSHTVCLFFTHGAPFKYAPVYTKNACSNSYVLANNDFVKHIYVNVFGVDETKIFNCINPRVLPLLDIKESDDCILRQKLNIDNSATLLVMLLTWSKDNFEASSPLDCFPFALNTQDLYELDTEYRKRNIFLLIKTHPMMKLKLNDNSLNGVVLKNVLVLDNDTFQKMNCGLYELLKSSDALITDFSSVFIDYYLTNKMVYFYEPSIDLESEKKKNADLNNGFVFDEPKQFMSGKFITSMNDFLLIDPKYDLATKKKKIIDANKLWNFPCDYHPCERIMSFLLRKEKSN